MYTQSQYLKLISGRSAGIGRRALGIVPAVDFNEKREQALQPFFTLGENEVARLSTSATSRQEFECDRHLQLWAKNNRLNKQQFVILKQDALRTRLAGQVKEAQDKALQRGESSGHLLVQRDQHFAYRTGVDAFEHFVSTLPPLSRRLPRFQELLRRQFKKMESYTAERWQEADRAAIAMAVEANSFFPKRNEIVLRALTTPSKDRQEIEKRTCERYAGTRSLHDLGEAAFGGYFGTKKGASPIHEKAFEAALGNDTPSAIAHLLAAELLSKKWFSLKRRFSHKTLVQILTATPDLDVVKLSSVFTKLYSHKLGPLEDLALKFQGERQAVLKILLDPKLTPVERQESYLLHTADILLSAAFPDGKIKNSKAAQRAYDFFNTISREERIFVVQNFKSRFGHAMLPPQAMRNTSSPAHLALSAVLCGDATTEKAARMKLDVAYSKMEQFLSKITNSRPEERHEYLRSFKQVFHEDYFAFLERRFAVDILHFRFRSRRGDLLVIQEIFEKGQASENSLIFAAVDGLGTDEKVLKKVLLGKTQAQLEELIKSYAAFTKKRTGHAQDLVKRIRRETSGEAWFDIEQQFRGHILDFPTRIARLGELMNFEQQRIKFEKLDRFSPTTRRLRSEVASMKKEFANLAAMSANPEFLALRLEIQEQRFAEQERLARRAVQALRLVKNVWADTVAKTVSIPATVSVFVGAEIAFGPGVSWYWPVVLAGLIGIGIFPLCKRLCKGKSYGGEEFIQDMVMALTDVGSRSMSRSLTGAAIRYVLSGTRLGTKMGVKHAIRAIQTGNDSRRVSPYLYKLSELRLALSEMNNAAQIELPRTVRLGTISGV